MTEEIKPTEEMMERYMPPEETKLPSGLSTRKELFAQKFAKIPFDETDKKQAIEAFMSIPGANEKSASREVLAYLKDPSIWEAIEAYRAIYHTNVDSLKKDRYLITNKIIESWETDETDASGKSSKVKTSDVLTAVRDKETLFGARESDRRDGTRVIIEIKGGDILAEAKRVNDGPIEAEISDAEFK